MGKEKRNKKDVVVIGVPLDSNSSYKRGAASAPAIIKEALYCDSSNLWTEDLIDLGALSTWHIKEDIEFENESSAFEQIENEIDNLLKKGKKVISLGGDHSITFPIIRAFAKSYQKLSILHLDAHPDLYDVLEGNRHSHACPFARIMEEELVVRLVQVGIRTMNGHQKEQVDKFGVEVIDMKHISTVRDVEFEGPVYMSIDLDCLDPAYAPGVSHHEPGGMSTREIIEIIQNLKGELVGADIVELNPERDIDGVTAMVAAKLLKEVTSKMFT